MAEAQSGRPARNPGIDLIRGASVLYIVGYWHLFNYTGAFPAYYNWVTVRLTVVVLAAFVLISGYLIGGRAPQPGWRGAAAFYRARLSRIYPPFLAAVVLFGWLQLASVPVLARSAAMLSMLLKPAPPTLWFVTMLLLFYAAAPPLLAAAASLRRYLVVCLLLTAGLAAAAALLQESVDVRLAIYCPAFLAGLLAARHGALLHRLHPAMLGAATAAAALVPAFDGAPPEFSLASIPMAVAGSLLVLALGARSGARAGSHPAVRVVSYAGFFMYLYHRVIFALLRDWYFPASGGLQVLYLASVCLPATLAASWAAQRAYDMLVSRFRTARGKPGQPLAHPA